MNMEKKENSKTKKISTSSKKATKKKTATKEVKEAKVEVKKPKKKRVNRLKNQKTQSSFEKASKKLQTRFNNLTRKDENAKDILNCLKTGSNSFLRVSRTENTAFDMSWIKEIEKAIPSIDEIIKNPRINTKNVTNVVPIELAKKTNSESIQHLATHSQYVKEIDENGDVIPSKILNIEAEDNYLTYENKFIATLIRRLVIFVEKRYEYIVKYSPLKDYDIMYVKNRSVINGVEYIVESKVIASKISESQSDKNISGHEFVKKVNLIRKYIKYFYASSFMKKFKNEKNVRSPIIQTNIIRKNPRYRKCYELYKFIERYDKLGVNFLIKEDYKDFDEKTKKEMYNLTLANVLTLKGSDAKYKIKSKKKIKKPKVLTTVDDDVFTFYPLGEDPEFIRVDEKYLDYKSANTETLKKKPKMPERKFAIGNYLKKGKVDKDKKRRDELLKRKKAEAIQFEKEQKLLLAEQEKEIARQKALLEKEEERRRQDELEKARVYVKEEANKYANELESILEEERKKLIEESLKNQENFDNAESNQDNLEDVVVDDTNNQDNLDNIEENQTNLDNLETNQEKLDESNENDAKNQGSVDLSNKNQEKLDNSVDENQENLENFNENQENLDKNNDLEGENQENLEENLNLDEKNQENLENSTNTEDNTQENVENSTKNQENLDSNKKKGFFSRFKK